MPVETKSPEMVQQLDAFSQAFFGRKRSECIANGICATCGGPAKEFRDANSEREFHISGMCQGCQDKFFA